MDARLLVSDTQGQTHEVSLAKDPVRLGGAAGDQIRLRNGPIEWQLLVFAVQRK